MMEDNVYPDVSHAQKSIMKDRLPHRRWRYIFFLLAIALVLSIPIVIFFVHQSPVHTPMKTYAEQEGHHGANTFTNPYNASGLGIKMHAASWVQVSCKVLAPAILSANPDGYWYRIASSPWNNKYYAVANTFMNGDPWEGPYTHNTDFKVPNC